MTQQKLTQEQQQAAQKLKAQQRIERDASVIIALGRVKLLDLMPYLSSEVFGHAYMKSYKIPTLCVTKRRVIMYNPNYITELYGPLREGAGDVKIASRLYHEVSHTMRHHCDYQGSEPAQVVNWAQDLAINSSGRATGMFEFGDGLLPEKFGFPDLLSWPQYLDLLMKNRDKWPQQCEKCGSGASNPGEGEEDFEGVGRSEEEGALISAQCAADIQAFAAQNPGKVAGGLLEWAAMVRKPSKVPWQKLTRRKISAVMGVLERNRAGMFQSYRNPDRRTFYRGDGIVYPSNHSPKPVIIFALDTSGSMQGPQFGLALREFSAALRASGMTEATLIQADHDVSEVRRVQLKDLERIQVKGRGGTNFCPAIELAIQQKAQMMVYLTDGYGPAPAKAPPFPIIWVCINGMKTRPAPYGELVVVEDDDVASEEV